MKRSFKSFMLIALIFQVQLVWGTETTASVPSSQTVQGGQPAMDIVLTIDNSGSMKKSDPGFLAGDVIARSLSELGEDLRVGMVIFDTRARLAISLTPTNIASRTNILSSLDDVNYRGLFSDSPAAIEMAVYELKNNGRKDAQKIIILITDGFVDTGDKQKDLERARWLKEDLAEEARGSGIRIFGTAFSDIADFSLFQILAAKTDGEYFRTYKAEDINNMFVRIRQMVSGQAALTATPEAGAGKTPAQMPETGLTEETTVETVEPKKASAGETEGAQNAVIPWKLILSGAILLLAIFAITIIYRRRSMKEDLLFTEASEAVVIPRATLIDINNITGSKTFVLGKKIIKIGRDPSNDIVIARDTISSFHAVIEYRDGSFYLEDQRSSNKTFLAGEELLPQTPRRLKSGDDIMFHIFMFKFFLPDTIPSGKTMIDFRAPSETVLRKPQDGMIQELPPVPKAILVDVTNITGKKTMHLKKSINRIGRGAGNEIEIPEESISGLHATIEYRDGFFYLEDQRSKNKTSLGGEQLEPHVPRKLKSGDEIVFDVYKFIFLLEYGLPSGDTGDGTGIRD